MRKLRTYSLRLSYSCDFSLRAISPLSHLILQRIKVREVGDVVRWVISSFFIINNFTRKVKNMKPTAHKRRRRILLAAFSLVLICFLAQSRASQAQQWNTNGNNISNANTGNVGVGTSSPGAKVDVLSSGNARVLLGDGCWNAATYGGIGLGITSFSGCANYSMMGDGTSTLVNAPSGNLAFRVGNADKMIVTSVGNVGIGTVSPTGKLQVQGDSNLANGSSYQNTLIGGTQTTANPSGFYMALDVNPYYNGSATLGALYGSTR